MTNPYRTPQFDTCVLPVPNIIKLSGYTDDFDHLLEKLCTCLYFRNALIVFDPNPAR